LQQALLPKDPSDERNVFLEIRGGTGGDESALFAGDLFRMYARFAERNGWRVEMVSESPGDMGGFKEVIARIVGQGIYGKLKFESGGHRVQRVPETEAQGRIHTSAATVAVLPEADPVADVTINPADLRINLALYKIDQIMDGDLFELTTALAQEFKAEQLAALGETA